MRDRLALVQQRIERDFAEPRLRFPGLEFRPVDKWAQVHPPVDPFPIGAEEIDDDYVCISGGHSFRVGSDLGDEEVTVEVASQLQDDPMDRRGGAVAEPDRPGGDHGGAGAAAERGGRRAARRRRPVRAGGRTLPAAR